MTRRAERLSLGRDAVISVSLAAELLPGSDAEMRAWLADRGLVLDHPRLGRCVIWGDVLAAIRADAGRVEGTDQVAPEMVPVRRPDIAKMPRRPLPGRDR